MVSEWILFIGLEISTVAAGENLRDLGSRLASDLGLSSEYIILELRPRWRQGNYVTRRQE